MSVQKVREKIALAKMSDQERNRNALAKLRANMALSGETKLERQINTIVLLTTGVQL